MTRYPERTSDSVTVGFGRFNPPTIGHERLIEHIAAVAERTDSDYGIFASHSQDPRKNPLDSATKTSYMREMFPDHAGNIIHDPEVRNIFDVLEGADKRGYLEVSVVVGSDRLEEFERIVNKYNGTKYNFLRINVISAGDRGEAPADNVSGMSASKLRKAVTDGDFEAFSRGIPDTMTPRRKVDMYEELRARMGKRNPTKSECLIRV